MDEKKQGMFRSAERSEQEEKIRLGNKEYTADGLKQLIGQYLFVFNSAEGRAVLEDLREFCGYHELLGCDMTDKQLMYRVAQKDMLMYIEAIIEKK